MFLRELRLLNFRNHPEAHLTFRARFNIICGNNGTGKTNLLDSIHYLSLGKSYFHHRDEWAVQQGKSSFLVSGLVEDSLLQPHEIKVSFTAEGSGEKSKKNIFRNQKNLKTLSEHMGFFPVVMVSPQDIEMLEGASELRRRFVNEMLCHTHAEYLQYLTDYRKILAQRNLYLKQQAVHGKPDAILMEAFNVQLMQSAIPVIEIRQRWLEEFRPLFEMCYRDIAPDSEPAEIFWRFSVRPEEFAEKLSAMLPRDLATGYTILGPHKDDLLLYLKGASLKSRASQGQKKSFLLALKMARYLYVLNAGKKSSPLLLDDIYDKLDATRFKSFMLWLKEKTRAQVFITDTHPLRMTELCRELQLDFEIFHTHLGEIHGYAAP